MKLEDNYEGNLEDCIDYLVSFFKKRDYMIPIVKKIEITPSKEDKYNLEMEMQGRI